MGGTERSQVLLTTPRLADQAVGAVRRALHWRDTRSIGGNDYEVDILAMKDSWKIIFSKNKLKIILNLGESKRTKNKSEWPCFDPTKTQINNYVIP